MRPQLEYPLPVWDNDVKATSTKSNRCSGTLHISRVIITDWTSSGTAVLQKLQWNSLQQRRAHSKVLMLYWIRNDLVAIPVAAYLEPVLICTRRFETRCVQIQCNTGTYSLWSQNVSLSLVYHAYVFGIHIRGDCIKVSSTSLMSKNLTPQVICCIGSVMVFSHFCWTSLWKTLH